MYKYDYLSFFSESVCVCWGLNSFIVLLWVTTEYNCKISQFMSLVTQTTQVEVWGCNADSGTMMFCFYPVCIKQPQRVWNWCSEKEKFFFWTLLSAGAHTMKNNMLYFYQFIPCKHDCCNSTTTAQRYPIWQHLTGRQTVTHSLLRPHRLSFQIMACHPTGTKPLSNAILVCYQS